MGKKAKVMDVDSVAKRVNVPASTLQSKLRLVESAMAPKKMRFWINEAGTKRVVVVERRGLGPLKTEYGKFWQFDFVVDDRWRRYSVLVRAELNDQTLLPVFKKPETLLMRTDSGCETGQVFGDLTCDCRKQLFAAMAAVNEAGEGAIIHIPSQDGRGMGLDFKLATLWLQEDLGLNTVEAAALLVPSGSPSEIDIRTYSGVVAILRFLGVPDACKIQLKTSNPEKETVFRDNGYEVNPETAAVPATEYTRVHLKAKEVELGHRNLVDREAEGK